MAQWTSAVGRARPSRHRFTLAIAALLLTSFWIGTPAQAVPAPDASISDPDSGPVITVDTQTLGLGGAITFVGIDDLVSVTLPVSDGLSAQSLIGDMQVPGGVARGWIDVESGDRIIGRVDIDATPPGPTSVSVSFPLSGAVVDQHAVTVALRLHLIPFDGVCPPDWEGRSVTIANTQVLYTGTPTPPTVIADFLPPILQELDLIVAPIPSAAESEAAVVLGAAVVAHYGSQPVQVNTYALNPDGSVPPGRGGPFVRRVTIADAVAAATELVPAPDRVPTVRVSGSGSALLDQTRLLTSKISAIAVRSRATAGSMDRPAMLAPHVTSLRNLGLSAPSNMTARGIGRARVVVAIAQSDLGRASHNLRVHLQGSYTPLPSTQAGVLTVDAGDHRIDSWPATADGRIDRWIDIPDDALRPTIDLAVTLTATGLDYECGRTMPVVLSIDPNSPVTSDAASPPIPPGFRSLPAALLPRVNVATSTTSAADLSRAVSMVAGMQAMTRSVLDPHWVTMSEAADSAFPAVLVASDGALPPSVTLPLARTSGATVTLTDPAADQPQTVTFESDITFASIQAFYDGTHPCRREFGNCARRAGSGVVLDPKPSGALGQPRRRRSARCTRTRADRPQHYYWRTAPP